MKCRSLLLLSILTLFLPKTGISATTADFIESAVTKPPIAFKSSPLGQRATAKEIFGSKKGYIHPFLSLGGYFTDNLFNTNDDEQSEYVGTVSPGIWLALPASRQQLLQVTTLNTAPGGLEVSRFKTDSERRTQGYALYRADIDEHKNFPSEDVVNQRAEGLLLHNFRGGLTVELVDIFERDHDEYATGVSAELDKFNSNLFNTIATYHLSPKFRIRGDYSHFALNYDHERNQFRDRDDNVLSAYVFFQFKPKTAAFLEYEYIDVDYDVGILGDSKEIHYFGGLQWEATAKSRGRIKVGYGNKDFKGIADDSQDLLLELQLDHRFTPKVSGYIQAYRKTNESDIESAPDMLTNSVQFGYAQKFTVKLSGSANLYYVRDSYRGSITLGTRTSERKDDYYSAGVALGYDLQEWLNLGAGYTFTLRDSNFNEFDYRDNTLYLNLTTAL